MDTSGFAKHGLLTNRGLFPEASFRQACRTFGWAPLVFQWSSVWVETRLKGSWAAASHLVP